MWQTQKINFPYNFVAPLKQANLAKKKKNDITVFVKKVTDFDENPVNSNWKGTSKKAKDVEGKAKHEKNLDDHITSYTKLINNLSGEIKPMPTKKLTMSLINRYNIHNDAKSFVESFLLKYMGLSDEMLNGSPSKPGKVACVTNEIINLYVTFEIKTCHSVLTIVLH